MQWIIIVVSLCTIAQGAMIVSEKNLNKSKSFYYIFLAISEFLLEVGMQTIFLFVTFKYWETARQLYYIVQIQENPPVHAQPVDKTDNSAQLRDQLETKHIKYSIYKWFGFAALVINGCVDGVLNSINAKRLHD